METLSPPVFGLCYISNCVISPKVNASVIIIVNLVVIIVVIIINVIFLLIISEEIRKWREMACFPEPQMFSFMSQTTVGS